MISHDYAKALYESLVDTADLEREKRFNNFIQLLKSNYHLNLLSQITREFEILHKKEQRKNTIEIITSQVSDKKTCEALVGKHEELGDIPNKNIKCSINSTLRGGYVIRSHTTQVDTTHKTKLIQLYNTLTGKK